MLNLSYINFKTKNMKKIYMILLAIATSTVLNAQYDLSVSLDNYTSGQATSANPLNLDFTITNSGAVAVPAGDSIFWAISISSNYYSTIDLAPGYVIYTILDVDFPAGASFQVDVMDMSMAWIHGALGSLSGNVCIASLGVNFFADTPPTDPNPLNNFMCVNYTVTSVASIDGNTIGQISVYPNPATNQVNFDLANNVADMITIFDISGRVIESIQINGSIESLNVENFENGIYFYQVINNNEAIKTGKFVVSK